MLKRSGLKITSLLLTALILISCFTAVSYAAAGTTAAQISVSILDKDGKEDINPARGDTVTVVVKIENYKTIPASISALFISVSFDPSYFEYVKEPGSDNKESHIACKVKNSDRTSYYFDGTSKVSFAYTYANNSKQSLDKAQNDIFKFRLKVKDTINNRTKTTIAVNEYELYKTDSEGNYEKAECAEPKAAKMTLWTRKPDFLINDSDEVKSVYNEDVTIKLRTGVASLSFEGRDPVTISNEYVCSRNGNYVLTVNGTSKVFAINKEITGITVKSGTYMSEYPLGSDPDYYNWLLSVTYKEGSPSEIPMDDDEITVTGFTPNAVGDHRLTITYKGQTTHLTIRVSSRKAVSFYVVPPKKTEYLLGDELDLSTIELRVVYDDGTDSPMPVTVNMVSGYIKDYLGEQTVSVSYPGIRDPQTFTVTVVSRDAVDALMEEINSIVYDAIDENSGDQLQAIQDKYDALSEVEKEGVTNKSQLDRAWERYREIVLGQVTETPTDEISETEAVTDAEGGANRTSRLNVIWFVVAGIIILAVIGGIIYFLVIYFKRKKEMDEDEYYDDGDYGDDTEDDGDLSYGDDIIDADEDDDDGIGPEPESDNAVTERVADPKDIFEQERIRQEGYGAQSKTVSIFAPVTEKPEETEKAPAESEEAEDDKKTPEPEEEQSEDDDDDFVGNIVILDDDDETEKKI